MSPERRTRAVLYLLLATAGWGYSFPGGKALMLALDAALPGRSGWFFSAFMISSRFALAALVLVAVYPRALRRFTAGEWRQGIGLGIFSGLGMLFQADGLIYTHASTVAFLTQFTAVLVPTVVFLRERQRPSAVTLACIVMVMAGVGILGNFDWHVMRFGRGEFETLIGTAFFTAQILWLDHPVFRGNDSTRVSIIMFAAIALVLAPVWISHAQAFSDCAVIFASTPIFAIYVSVMAICSLGSFLLMNRFQPAVDPTTAGIIYCAEPLFATLLALVLPAVLATFLGVEYANERFTPALIFGGSLIVLANILISLQPAPKAKL